MNLTEIRKIEHLDICLREAVETGGLRNGLHVAKAIALGANLCGIALPFLRILSKEGVSGVDAYVEALELDFRHALFLTGCKDAEALRRSNVIFGTELKAWMDQRNLDR
jgi:isopentenyl-diphosphate delta-isomerase